MSAYSMMNALMTPGLTPTEGKVYAYLVGRANGARVCWPTVEDIAADLHISRRAVIDATTTLQGVPRADPPKPRRIEVKRRFRQTNTYVVLDVPGLDDKPSYTNSKASPASTPFPWHQSDTDADVQKTAPMAEVQISTPIGDSMVQNSAHMDPVECKIPRSEVQKTSPESVQQESIKEEKVTLLRNGDAALPPSADPPDEDVRKQLWSEGRTILRDLVGQLTSPAGKQIGRFLKTADDNCAVVLDAMRAAQRERPPAEGVIGFVTAGIQARLRPEPTYRNPANQIAEALGLHAKAARDEFARSLTPDTSAFMNGERQHA